MGLLTGLVLKSAVGKLVVGGVVGGIAGKVAEPAINAAHGFVSSLLSREPSEDKESFETSGTDDHASCSCKGASADVSGVKEEEKTPKWFGGAIRKALSGNAARSALPPMPPPGKAPPTTAGYDDNISGEEDEAAGFDDFASGLDDDDTGDFDDMSGDDDDDDTEGYDDNIGGDDDDTGDFDDMSGDDDDDTEGYDDNIGGDDDDTGDYVDAMGGDDDDIAGVDGEDCGCNI